MRFHGSFAGRFTGSRNSRSPSLRSIRFEALETRTLLSATATGAAAALEGDTVLAASAESGESASWIDSLTSEQARGREQLLAMLDSGGTIDDLESFEPVAMPESFLDELYDTYSDYVVWESVGPEAMYQLFGADILLWRGDTRCYPASQNTTLTAVEYDAGEYADNGLVDYFDLTRSGDELVLTISEDTDSTEGVSLATRSTVTLDATEVVRVVLNGSGDADVFRIHNLGDFGGDIAVNGVESDSVTDSVQVYDTEGDDVWIAAEGLGIFRMEDAYDVTVSDVGVLHGYATAGGDDQARLFGNDSSNKLKAFEGEMNLARLYKGGVFCRAKFFESVDIDGGDGEDTAILYGTPGDDQFTATKDEGAFESTVDGGFSYAYERIETVRAYGGSGEDHASYADSALADEVRLRVTVAEIGERGAEASYLSIRQFDTFYAEASSDDGQADIVKMHDTDSADLLTAEMEEGQVHARFYADTTEADAAGLIYESLGFEITKGYSSSDGDVRDVEGVDAGLLAWNGTWEDA